MTYRSLINLLYTFVKIYIMKISYFFLFFVSALFITSCGTTSELSSSWNSEAVSTPKKYEKLAVIALGPNERYRSMFELTLTQDLIEKSVKANVGSNIFPLANSVLALTKEMTDSAEVTLIKKGIEKKVKSKNVDALLFVTLVNVDKKLNYTTEAYWDVTPVDYESQNELNSPDYYKTSTYGNYYSTATIELRQKGYYEEESTYFIEARLYDTESGKLIWIGQTKTVADNKFDVDAEIVEVCSIITDQLVNVDEVIR